MPFTKNTTLLIVFYLGISIFLIFADSKGSLNFLHTFFQNFTVPTRSAVYNFRTNILAFSFSTKGSSAEINKLQTENATLLAKIAELGTLTEENEKSRRLLGAEIPPAWQFQPAKVVSITGDEATLLLESQAEIDNHAITSQSQKGVYVGKITNITGKLASLVLPTSQQSRIPVTIRKIDTGAKQASGILIGEGGELLLDQVLTKETLAQGDLVVTSGEAGFPPELLIGQITEVLPVKQESFRQARVQMTAKVDNLETIFLVTQF